MPKLIKAAVGIFIITVLSKFLGIAREAMLAYKYGASYITDAFVISLTVPTVIFSILLSGIVLSYIPVYSRIKSKEERVKFNSTVISLIFLLSGVLTFIMLLMKEEIVSALAPGFDMKTYSLAVKMTSIVILLLPIKSIFNIIAGYLNCKEDFLMLNFCNSIIVNIFIMLAIIISSNEQLMMLPAIYVFGEVMSFCILCIYSAKKGFKYRPYLNINDKHLKELGRLAFPMGLSLMTNQLNSVIDRSIASTLLGGSITVLNYADKLQLLVLNLTITIIATVSYPKLNKLFSDGNVIDALENINNTMMLAAFICIPVSFALVIFAVPIVHLVFERGSFDASNTLITAQCLAAYAIGILFYGYREIITQALAANKLQKKVFINSLFAVIFNIVLNYALVKPLRHIGLALATSITGILSFILIYRTLRKNIGSVGNGDMPKELAKILGATLIIIPLIFLAYRIFNVIINSNMALILVSIIGCIIYVILCYLFKVKICRWVIDFGKEFLQIKRIK